MNVEATFNLTSGRAPARAANAVSALIRDRLGNPIALFFERADGTIRMLTAADPEFGDGLNLIGVPGPAVKRLHLNDVDASTPNIISVSG